MRKLNYIFIVVAVTFLFTGCGVVSQTQVSKGQLYPKMYKKHPKSILVLPAKNTTTSVDATDHFRYTITRPLAEKGYYIFPVHLVDSFFKSENLTNAEQIRQIPVTKLKEIFNADAILYVDINAWDTSYAVLSSSVDVGLSFSLIDANTGEEIWQNNAYAYSFAGADGNNGLIGLIAGAIDAAINTSVDYTQLSYSANWAGVGIMPSGQYSKYYKKDAQYKFTFRTNTNLKDGRLYVNEYFIYGENSPSWNQVQSEDNENDLFGNTKKEDEIKVKKLPLIAKFRAKGYHGFPVFNMNFFKHSGYDDYYITQNINDKRYLRNRFFRYENNRPYLLSNGKKVFVFTESDGTIPFSEESGDYYFNIDRIIELKSSTPNKT